MIRSLVFCALLVGAARGDYEARRREFVEHSTRDGARGLYAQVSRMASGLSVNEAPVRAAIAFIDARRDTSDFQVAALIRLYHNAKPGQIAEPLRAEIKKTLLGFKYWVDEPGDNDLMCTWSENHQILFHSAEFLAGEMFAAETFVNNGKSGVWHRDQARVRVLRWIQTKARAGFTEWDSNAYYPEDMAALLNLADFAQDKEVAQRAAMLLDLMFFDMAVDSFRGTYGSSHGRTYSGTVQRGSAEGTTGVQYMAWGMGSLGSADNVATVFLANSKYRVARLIEEIALDMPAELLNRERQGLTIDSARTLGLRFENLDEQWLMWDSGRLNTRALAEQSLGMMRGLHLHRFDVVIRPYAEAVLGVYKALSEMGVEAEGMDRTSLQQVNKVTYRTPDYQLSAAQDYRKGKAGYQQHIWQATLGAEQIVFTLNPSVSSKYWVGWFPKVVQAKNLLIAIYDIPSKLPPGPKTIFPPDAAGNAMPSPSPAESLPAGYTVAMFRRKAFDEVVEKNGWVFGRKGEGYVALRSQMPVRWSEKEAVGGEGLVAEGRRNIWICQMGRQAVDGAFAQWVERVAGTALAYDGLRVRYGNAAMGWDEPMTIDGKAVETEGYARFDNPYCKSEWGSGKYTIRFKGRELKLQFRQ